MYFHQTEIVYTKFVKLYLRENLYYYNLMSFFILLHHLKIINCCKMYSHFNYLHLPFLLSKSSIFNLFLLCFYSILNFASYKFQNHLIEDIFNLNYYEIEICIALSQL